MAKVTVDVVLNDGEDSTTFGDSFSSNDNVEVRNPMVSNPSLIGVNVEESYFNTFKSDSRIKIAQRADEFRIASTGTPPAFTSMTNKKIVVSTGAWDVAQPGSNFIPAQFYYDTDIIPSDVTVPSDAEVKSVDDNGNKFLRRKTNSDWNESETYISREDRKEWDTVGLMGKLRLRKGQPTGTNWIKMRDISDSVEEWLVR